MIRRPRPLAPAVILALALGLGLGSPALAQTTSSAGGNIGSLIQHIIDILNNNDLRRAGTVVLGIIVIFSASTIVGLVTGSGATS